MKPKKILLSLMLMMTVAITACGGKSTPEAMMEQTMPTADAMMPGGTPTADAMMNDAVTTPTR